ncbi:hypothetical protein BDV25DRAFT_129929 [Aspergillus avenaceus]|uniref:Glycosyltransferase family 31 protein n=1 Tax=Aspergillus avenaceus TaxID=36643 RepID=A0A5N6TUM2_ASPAV|nr:hypothetical protein BDV25DRAFT_129929 [Aspergillus avenaceus]
MFQNGHLMTYELRYHLNSYPSTWSDHRSNRTCFADLHALRRFGFNASVDYDQRETIVTRTKGFTRYSDNINARIPAYRTISLNRVDNRRRPPLNPVRSPINLEAPLPLPPPNASHLLFGVATTLDRLNAFLTPIALWAADTDARVIAVIEPDRRKGRLMRQVKHLGIHLKIIESTAGFLDRHFSLIQMLYIHQDTQTKWVALIDDDTFFSSMSNLYIGAVTEDFKQLHECSYMAYGGAGIFLSVPLLNQLNEVYYQCSFSQETGDRRVAQCIYTHTMTKLTWERRLYQLDVHDASGFYESGRVLPLSLHHWKSWYEADVAAMGAVASICGDDCQLRRWQLSNNSFLINGFSIEHGTNWDSSDSPDRYAYSLGPLRPRDAHKISLRLKHVISGKGSVRQIYTRELDRRNPQVIEIIWRVDN